MKHTLTLILTLLCFSAFSQVTHIEAENCINNFGLTKEVTQDVGAGLELGYIDANDWADYTINPTSDGVYSINFRVSGISAGQINVISGSNTLASIVVPITGAWQTWTTITTTLSLKAGQQTIRLLFVKGGINLNWFELTGLSVASQITTATFTALKTQVDSLTSKLNTLQNQISSVAPTVLYFKKGSLLGSNTPTDPYYFVPLPPLGSPVLNTTTTKP